MLSRNQSRRRPTDSTTPNIWNLFVSVCEGTFSAIKDFYEGAIEHSKPAAGAIIQTTKKAYTVTRTVIGGYTLPISIISLKITSSVGDALFSFHHFLSFLGKVIGKDITKNLISLIILTIVAINNAVMTTISRGPATFTFFRRLRSRQSAEVIEEMEALTNQPLDESEADIALEINNEPSPVQTTQSTLLNILEKFLTYTLSSSLFCSGIFAALNNFNGFPETVKFSDELFELNVNTENYNQEILAAATAVVTANFIVFLAYQFKQGRANAERVARALAHFDLPLNRSAYTTLFISSFGMIARAFTSYYSTGNMVDFLKKWLPISDSLKEAIRYTSAGNAVIAILLNGTADLYQLLREENSSLQTNVNNQRMLTNTMIFSALLEGLVMTSQAFSSMVEEIAQKIEVSETDIVLLCVGSLIALSYGIPQTAFLWKGVKNGLNILFGQSNTSVADIYEDETAYQTETIVNSVGPSTPFRENLETLIRQRAREAHFRAANEPLPLRQSAEVKQKNKEKIIESIIDETLAEHARITTQGMPAPFIRTEEQQQKENFRKLVQQNTEEEWEERARIARQAAPVKLKGSRFGFNFFDNQREDSATELEPLNPGDKGKDKEHSVRGEESLMENQTPNNSASRF